MTLVELAMTLVFVAALVTSVVSMATRQAGMRRSTEQMNMAFRACRNALEEMRLLPFAGVLAMNGQGFDVPGFNGEPGALTPVPGDPDGLPGEFLVTVDQSAGGETIYWVTVRVTWRGTLGRQNFQLRTLFAQREV